MLVKGFLSNEHILKFCSHTCTYFTIKMGLFKMLDSLFIIIEVYIFKLLWALMTNKTFLMCMLKMPSELINIIKSLFTKSTGRMVKNKISILTELSLLNVFLILTFRIKDLLWMNAFPIVETNIAILSFMFQIKMFL